MSSKYTRFSCGELDLGGELYLPEGEGPFPGVVICHPHPLYNGNMMNNVVTAIYGALSQQSVVALRFNFRGVGNSDGVFSDGIGEQEDARAAVDYLRSLPEVDAGRIGLAGYSFGAGVALAVALGDERVARLALVSLPLSDAEWERLKEYRRPKFLIVGDADPLMRLEIRGQDSQGFADPRWYQMVVGADHFWLRHKKEMAEKVTRFFVGD